MDAKIDITQQLTERLTTFLNNNPLSKLTFDENENIHKIELPWGDDSLELIVNEGDSPLVETLNKLLMPERFSGIYHYGSKRLEIAYTVFPPEGERSDISTRKFDFLFEERLIKCEFSDSSEDLLQLARHARPVGSFGSTQYRNLQSYTAFVYLHDPDYEAEDELKNAYKDARPISFWIDVGDWEDDYILDLVTHLNFYMNYFDRQTPLIIVHHPTSDRQSKIKVKRFTIDKFPESIQGRRIKKNLISLWHATNTGDQARRFLYAYQILEFASYYVIEEDVAKSIAKLLCLPHAMSMKEEITAKILDVMSETKLSEPQKLEHLLRRVVDPRSVWKAIEPNREFFCETILFEGGYKIDALLHKNSTEDDFVSAWPTKFASILRNTRNALSHGREQRSTSVIVPTVSNMDLLRPWIPAILSVAEEVLLFHDS